MTENRLVMVSEWVSEGYILEFTRTDSDMNQLELACFPLENFIPLPVYDRVIAVAERRYQRG